MTCYYCGGDMAETTTTYFEHLENTIMIIKNVPFHKCMQCGEIVYNATVVGRLEQIVEQLEKALTEIAIVTIPLLIEQHPRLTRLCRKNFFVTITQRKSAQIKCLSGFAYLFRPKVQSVFHT